MRARSNHVLAHVCVAALAGALSACAANGSEELRDGGAADGGRGRDGALELVDGNVAIDDAGHVDDGDVEDGGSDAGLEMDGGVVDVDGGLSPTPIELDGILGAAEWADAASATGTTVTAWDGNTLTRLVAVVRGSDLYVGFEATLMVGADNAVLVYVDNERGSGVGIEDPITLTDGVGALDNALSAGITTPADFEADFAFGTRDMGRSASGDDDRMGWRDIADLPSDFSWVSATDAPATCSATACETRISLARLGGTAGRPLAIFARLGNTDGTMLSNQTLPMDAPATPGSVSVVLDVPR